MKDYKALADKARRQCADKIGDYADKRLFVFSTWFHKNFPRHELKILFGNGAHFIDIDQRRVDVDPVLGSMRISSKANVSYATTTDRDLPRNGPLTYAFCSVLRDVYDITNYYNDACPTDVHVRPVVRGVR